MLHYFYTMNLASKIIDEIDKTDLLPKKMFHLIENNFFEKLNC